MSAPTNVQIINGQDGNPAFVVIPYADFLNQYDRKESLIPNAVVGKVIMEGMTPIRAWREHLGLSQAEAAARLGMEAAEYAKLEEPGVKPRRPMLRRVAEGFSITLEQLDF